MRIVVRNSYEPRRAPAAVTVFFDIFRASTTLLALMSQKPRLLVAVNDAESARRYAEEGYALFSEVYPGGYDNSPVQGLAGDFHGKDVVHKSANLTEALFANAPWQDAYVGSFVNLTALGEHLRALRPESVELVAAAKFHHKREAVEDSVCARSLRTYLETGAVDVTGVEGYDQIVAKLAYLKSQAERSVPKTYWQDVDLALSRDRIPVLARIVPHRERSLRIESV